MISPDDIRAILGNLAIGDRMADNDAPFFVSVNTQARRLGCLLYLLGEIGAGRGLEALLMTPSLNNLLSLRENIRAEGLMSGELTSSKSSIRHYLELGFQFKLMVAQGALYNLTSSGALLAKYSNGVNPYPLGDESRLLLWHAILSSDYFGMQALVQALLQGAQRVSTICDVFPSILIERLQRVSVSKGNDRLSRAARDKSLVVMSWKKPRVYAEHLVSARINWLIDLGIVRRIGDATGELTIDAMHLAWCREFTCDIGSEIASIAAWVLNYALSCEARMLKVGGCLDVALKDAFDLLDRRGGLCKVRVSDLIRFLICCRPSSVIDAVREGRHLMPDTFAAGGWSYAVHAATRATQAYVTCRILGDEK